MYCTQYWYGGGGGQKGPKGAIKAQLWASALPPPPFIFVLNLMKLLLSNKFIITSI